ncbi:MAG: prephenate dehydratase [Planctomycetota bacterium]
MTTPADDPNPAQNAHDAALAPLRAEIDQLDARLIELLNQRARVVVDIGKVKQQTAGPIYAPERERRVLDRIHQLNQGPLPDSCIAAIWRELMSGSFALERPLRIGYLGPPGSFSHAAAASKFGASVEYDNLDTIPMIFDAVRRGHCDYGLAPIENSTEGSVNATLDGLMEDAPPVCAEVVIAIHHNLLANGDAPGIRKVYSHPQALAQCRNWLAAQFPRVEQVAASSTSKAAEIASQEPGAAAIASTMAAKLHGLLVQFENIEDRTDNNTRFLVIGDQKPPATGRDKTALLFTLDNRAGALAEVLRVFADRGLNLTHIDKRPSRAANWEYAFFVDVDAHRDDPPLRAAVDAIAPHCRSVRVLGSFPSATGE